MTRLTDSVRLKIKSDTFIFPDSSNGVYFRNSSSSFRMKGGSIVQWIERLVPMFNGERSLGELTQGLPPQYRNRVFDIGEALYLNGFARDVSKDKQHYLEKRLLYKYASQIEFIENFVDSGAYHFQLYRQTKVLVVGSGAFLVSLISSLLDSGLTTIDMVITDSTSTDLERLKKLEESAVKVDKEVVIKKVAVQKGSSWRAFIEPYEWILFVSENGNVEDLRAFHTLCRDMQKKFLPTIMLEEVGLVGPFVHPDSEGDWESAWRRVTRNVLYKNNQKQNVSSVARAMLANVMTFEFFKIATRVTESEERNQFFLLDLETLEGDWHSFLAHPLLNTEHQAPRLIHDLTLKLKEDSIPRESSDLLHHFDQITSAVSGIFYKWEEGELKQLPLSQCYVQVVDPLTEGPAKLLPSIIRSGMTHEEAQREAGLAGIEAYVGRMNDVLAAHCQDRELRRILSGECVGIGAGETIAEAVSRGLQMCLEEELAKQKDGDPEPFITQIQMGDIQDKHCKFYYQTLKTMVGEPIIGLGDKLYGFPVVWVGTNGGWYRSVGLNQTMALRNALQQANMQLQNSSPFDEVSAIQIPSFVPEDKIEIRLDIPSSFVPLNVLQSALKILKEHRLQLITIELPVEPFLKEKLAGVYGVVLRKEEFR